MRGILEILKAHITINERQVFIEHKKKRLRYRNRFPLLYKIRIDRKLFNRVHVFDQLKHFV